MAKRASLICLLGLLAATATALELPTAARQTAARDSALAQVALPVGPFDGAAIPTEMVEGAVTRRAYRLPGRGLTPLQILAPLRAQLEQSGFDILLDCDQDTCGGFDFRFGIEVLPAPNMYVNIRAYHAISARAGPDAAVLLLASAADSAAYLQVITVGEATLTPLPADDTPAPTPEVSPPVLAATPQDFTERLLQTGAAVLHDLDFALGTTELSNGPSAELAALAALLETRPGLQIAVVGHTDTTGGLDTNIAVSRARANAVRDRLIGEFGLAPERIEAAGMGYLAPAASNLTEEGRAANRRVEVIILRETQ